jgi:cold shock CspA family protein
MTTSEKEKGKMNDEKKAKESSKKNVKVAGGGKRHGQSLQVVDGKAISQETDMSQESGKKQHAKEEQKKSKGKKPRDQSNKIEEAGVQEGLYSGFVVVRQEGFGFIKSDQLDSRVYFHVKDTDKKCHGGCQVEFVLGKDERNGKMVAKQVKMVAPSAVQQGDSAKGNGKSGEIILPGKFTGVVNALPKSGADVPIDDGMISFVDSDGQQQQAMFGNWRVAAESRQSLSEGCHVQFDLAQNTSTKVYKTQHVELDVGLLEAVAAAQASLESCLDEPAEPQLGKVALLKKEFGFIKRLGHSLDLFFHFSEVDGNPEGLKVGDELEFVVRQDSVGRKYASKVTRVAKGSIQFEVIGNEVFHGVVVEKPAMTKHYQKTAGIIDYQEKPLESKARIPKHYTKQPCLKILFHSGENPGTQSLRNGDHIYFKMLTDVSALKTAESSGKGAIANLIGRRATMVQPIKLIGTIVDMNASKKFGFLTWKGILSPPLEMMNGSADCTGLTHTSSQDAFMHETAQERLFFHFSELQNGESIEVKDQVYFVLHTNRKSNELTASRIRLKSKGTNGNDVSHAAPIADGLLQANNSSSNENSLEIPDTGSKRPAYLVNRKLKATPQSQSHQIKMAKGPDGTRGFSRGRGSSLSPENPAAPGSVIAGMFAGLHLRGIFPGDMHRSLSAEALPFNPGLGLMHQ